MHVDNFDYQYIRTIKKGFISKILLVKKNNENYAVRVIQDLHSRINVVRAIREVVLLSNCNHENIIKMVDVLIDSPKNLNTIYIVLPLMDYTLKHFIGLTKWREKNPNYYIRRIMIQILRALNYLDFNKIIHRDVTPENIMMKEDNLHLKLIDFEVARELIDRNDIFTVSQTAINFHCVPCTAAYQAPERLLRLDYYDTKIDIWPAGCIFAELISGHPLISDTSSYTNILTDIFSLEKGIPNIFQQQLEEIFSSGSFRDVCNTTFKNIEERLEFPSPNDDDIDRTAHSAKNGIKVLKGLLQLDPEKRWNAEMALKSEFFGNNYIEIQCHFNSKKCSDVFKEANFLLDNKDTKKLTELLMTQIKDAPRFNAGSNIEVWSTGAPSKFKNIFGTNIELLK